MYFMYISRALAIKRKTEAEREEKRRKQILAKRHDRVKEATERFQRAGLPARPDSGSSGKYGYLAYNKDLHSFVVYKYCTSNISHKAHAYL